MRRMLSVFVGVAGTCADAMNLTFSGNPGDHVGTQVPFSFPNWNYDSQINSSPPDYSQSIFEEANTQVVNITNASGIRLCSIAASTIVGSATGAATNATFQGVTLGGRTVTTTQSLPVWNEFAKFTLDSTWQPLSAIVITTSGDPAKSSTELWEITYVLLD
ncbi:hypothetical protein COCOBI_10-0450 [Coccomyxa sp. Obi]|nr:hypothetical protein COCOBI_10-0450 [Coccomyxa sp. Obi]